MSNLVTTAAPDEDKPMDISRLTDVQKSDAHFDQLLSVANHSMQLLVQPDSIGNTVSIDEEAKAAARSTYIMAHVRMRDLIDEEKRWGLQATAAEAKCDDLMTATETLYKQKTVNAKIFNRPSVFLRAQIRKFTVGWIAWVGGDVPTTDSLHGVGASPALATKAFDDNYYDVQKAADTQPPIHPEIVQKIQKTPKRKNDTRRTSS